MKIQCRIHCITIFIAYVSYLREYNISYIFAGKDTIDFETASEKLHDLFGIKTLIVSGGGIVNWSFLEAGLIDEVSIVMTPITDGDSSTNTIFERGDFMPEIDPVKFSLKEVKQLDGDVVWLNYSVRN